MWSGVMRGFVFDKEIIFFFNVIRCLIVFCAGSKNSFWNCFWFKIYSNWFGYIRLTLIFLLQNFYRYLLYFIITYNLHVIISIKVDHSVETAHLKFLFFLVKGT